MKNLPTDIRRAWWGSGNSNKHPDSPLKTEWYLMHGADTPVCPYCGDTHSEPYGIEINGCDTKITCQACDKDYMVAAEFPGGYFSRPITCRERGKAHRLVFGAQYYYTDSNSKFTSWRTHVCLDCWDSQYVISRGDKVCQLLPWLPEYDNPDYFDPEGVLISPNPQEEIESPILKALFPYEGSKFHQYMWDEAMAALEKKGV